MQWDVETGTSTAAWSDHGSDVMSLDVRPNDATCSRRARAIHSVRVWDVRVSQKHAVACLTAFPSDVNDVRWFPDSEALGAAGDDHSCRLMDLPCHSSIDTTTRRARRARSRARLLFAGRRHIHPCVGVSATQNPRDDHEARITESRGRMPHGREGGAWRPEPARTCRRVATVLGLKRLDHRGGGSVVLEARDRYSCCIDFDANKCRPLNGHHVREQDGIRRLCGSDFESLVC